MAQPVFPDSSTISSRQSFPLPNFMLRNRREINTKDTINALHYEHWQTGSKYGNTNRPDLNKQAPFQDMMPNNSRKSDRDFRSQPRFDVDGNRGGQNSYFNKYDTSFDARNTTRELRASVYEDMNTGYSIESEQLLQRNTSNHWRRTIN